MVWVSLSDNRKLKKNQLSQHLVCLPVGAVCFKECFVHK